MRFFITFFLSSFLFSISFSQTGKIEGKITDSKSGNVLSGVSVTTTVSEKGAATNVDGGFVLTLNAGTYTIRLTSVGYKTKEIEGVEVTTGAVVNVDVVLESAAKTETEVVVRSSRRLESTVALLSYQKNTNTVAQVVSAESIRRSPDKNTGEVLKRVSGTSIQD
ncbi:MAG: carboxypeptidase-like regulatory domain-containing protein, partial [Ginsengibacter sp.]